MKTQINHTEIFKCAHCFTGLLQAGIILICCLVSKQSFSQMIVKSSSTNQTFKLLKPESLISAGALKQEISILDMAGTALSADAASGKEELEKAVNDVKKAKTMLDDDQQYQQDLRSFNADMADYKSALDQHNITADANNRLQPDQRDQDNVNRINIEKKDLDKRAVILNEHLTALVEVERRQEMAVQTAEDHLNAARRKTVHILKQLLDCADYAKQCKTLLKNKFNENYDSSRTRSFFGSSVYKIEIKELKGELEDLAANSGYVFDGRKVSN